MTIELKQTKKTTFVYTILNIQSSKAWRSRQFMIDSESNGMHEPIPVRQGTRFSACIMYALLGNKRSC